jgi:hypothetical protein
MSDWEMDKEEPPPRDWGDIRNKALIGLGCTAAVIAWMVFARPTEQNVSGTGFDMGSAGGSSKGDRPFAARPKTSLDMVSSAIGDGPPGVDPGIYRGVLAAPTVDPAAPAAAASPAAAAGPPPPAAPAPARNPAAMPPAPSNPADEAKTLASAGIPTDARGLANLGATEGMLSSMAAKLLDHPKVLAAIFNNKTVVNAFMARSGVKENCENGGALKSYLSDPKSGGMSKVFPIIQQALSRPDGGSGLVSALAGTEMVKAVSGCPSLKAIGNDSSSIAGIAMANPKALGLLMDPRGAAALASNPQAAGALAGLQGKMAGAP